MRASGIVTGARVGELAIWATTATAVFGFSWTHMDMISLFSGTRKVANPLSDRGFSASGTVQMR